MKKPTIKTVFFFYCLSLFLLVSCNSNTIIDKAVNIPKGLWNENSPVNFTFPVNDTLGYYSIIFSVRNDNKYRYSNLYLFVETFSPNGNSRKDTIEVSLAEDNGKWLGSGIGGIWQNKYYFRKNIRFPQQGEYKININQAMREKELEGIIDFGLKIEPFKQ